ncbi:alginate lyase family protein [Streptomyces sp. NPDC060205]|uniref:alginate lyase family protein n=1 Tax=Streptomyces sp. NPDC060205 TaxID=3347072 RepID=UPI00364EF3B5
MGKRVRRLAVLMSLALFVGLLGPVASAHPGAAPTRPVPAGADHSSTAQPRTVVLDGGRLRQTRVRLQHGDPQLRGAVTQLTGRADNWLNQGPWTVVDKPRPAPSGDVHDYLSQAPYWWPSQSPTADNPWGCPYVQRDGERNPEVDSGTDRLDLEKVFDASYDLALAWHYTGKRQYAEKAAQVLRTWFLASATRMNPDLDHAQFIPCKYDGRAIGIIDFSQSYTAVLDAVAILESGAPAWSRADRAGMRQWNSDFLHWLTTSEFGRQEAAAANNHGTFYDLLVAGLASATGEKDLARRTVREAAVKRIDPQIAADGSQPQELTRTRSWHYSTFDLVAYTRLAAIGQHLGVDLWRHRGPEGQNLFQAVRYLLPAATGRAAWPHPELEFRRFAASDVVHAAADAGDRAARQAVPLLEEPPGGDLWALRPAAEQLDSITG